MNARKLIHQLSIMIMVTGLNFGNPVLATESDIAKEARWADQIVDSLLDGDGIWLDDGNGHKFLGIFTEAEAESVDEPKQAVILVHGIGVHPDWPEVVSPLRVGLVTEGWSTLSIQMPILANGVESQAYTPLFAELAGRFDSAISYLNQQGIHNIAVVAHSMGATMSAHFVARALARKEAGIQSFVAIGMGAGIPETDNGEAGIDSLADLKKITIPMFDIYGSEDLTTVLESAGDRAVAAKSSNDNYSQLVVTGAEHFFSAYESDLINKISSWLSSGDI
jgi:pimeloyl-ACP methyl ester carboxylesterase